MGLESGAIVALTLGFLLGLKHATDADHVVAVSTIVGEDRNAWRGIWVGGSWGLGHTTPLLILGVIILTFKEAVLDQYESVAPIFEFGVGIMLVLLGVQDAGAEVEKAHGFFRPGKPFFRLKSYTIGVVHGLAGSAAVMLVLLPTLSSFWVGVGYIVLFGVGTMLSMAAITLLLGVPFALTGDRNRLSSTVASIAGTASLAFGVALMSDIAMGTSLLPF